MRQTMSNEFDIAIGQIEINDNVETMTDDTLSSINDLNDAIGQEIEQADANIGSFFKEPNQQQNVPKRDYQSHNEPLDAEKPVNLKELVDEQGKLLQNLLDKSQRLENMQLDEEGKGILTDFKNQIRSLDEKTLKIMAYFGENISDEDRALINRTLLLKQGLGELYDLIKYFESKDYINKTHEFEKKFRNLIRASKERVDNFENNLKKALDTSMPVYNEILKHFIERKNELLDNFYREQKDKGEKFAKELNAEIECAKKDFKDLAVNFELTSKKLRNFALALLCGFGLFGILFGVISAMTYLKYQEYQEIEQKMHSLSTRINNIIVKKDEANNLILSLPKTNAVLNSDKNSIHITIKEAQ